MHALPALHPYVGVLLGRYPEASKTQQEIDFTSQVMLPHFQEDNNCAWHPYLVKACVVHLVHCAELLPSGF